MKLKNGGVKAVVERRSMAWNLRKAKRSQQSRQSIQTRRTKVSTFRRLSAASPLLETRISKLTLASPTQVVRSKVEALKFDFESLESSSESEDGFESSDYKASTPVKFKRVPSSACLKPTPFRPLPCRLTSCAPRKTPSLPNLPRTIHGENNSEVKQNCFATAINRDTVKKNCSWT